MKIFLEHLPNPAFIAFLFLNLFTSQVLAHCTCEPEDNHGDKAKALKYKLIAFASILTGGGIGVSLPFLGKIIPALQPEKDRFFLIKAFAAGVILATGFIHILPSAFHSLTSPCLKEHPWGDFPFTGLVAMAATIMTLMVETSAAGYQLRLQLEAPVKPIGGNGGDVEDNPEDAEEVVAADHTHAAHSHAHGVDPGLTQVNRVRIVSKVLEAGIIIHSVIIGLTLGASQSPKTIKPLVAALTFHQFFEGVGLGGCISQAKLKSLSVMLMGGFFTLTTPMGIVIGIIITNSYKENTSRALIVEGVLNATSAGILIYMALVDLLSPDFMNPRMQRNNLLQFGSYVSLLLGAGLMSLLAKWA